MNVNDRLQVQVRLDRYTIRLPMADAYRVQRDYDRDGVLPDDLDD